MNQNILNDEENLFVDESSNNINRIVSQAGIFKFKCEDCGNKIITQTRLTNCIICNSNHLCEEEYTGELDSLLVLPFSKTVEDAKKTYKKKVMFNPVIPFLFKKKNVINTIKKVYVKNTSFDLKISGETTFLAVDNHNVNNNQKKYKVVLNSNFDYNDVLVNNISKVNDDLFERVGNYNFNNLVNYESSFLNNGVYVLERDIELEEKARNNALKCSLNVIKDNVKHDKKKLDKNDMGIIINSKKEVLVPIYLLKINYENKDYFYLMNGVTGEDVIETTIGKLEVVLFSLVVFLIIFVIAFLIAYFL